MTLHILATYAAAIFLLIGAVFALIAVLGLLKFNDSMARLHAPTKVGTIGIGSLLVASMIQSFNTGNPSLHEVLIMAFLFVTAPISANFMAKVNIHQRTCDTPPAPKTDTVWSVLNTSAEDKALSETTDTAS